MRDYDDGTNVLIRFHAEETQTPKARLLLMSETDTEGVWFPKSQIKHIDTETCEVWIPLWLAEKKGLDYE